VTNLAKEPYIGKESVYFGRGIRHSSLQTLDLLGEEAFNERSPAKFYSSTGLPAPGVLLSYSVLVLFRPPNAAEVEAGTETSLFSA